MFFISTFCLIFILGVLIGAYLLYSLANSVPSFDDQKQYFKSFIQANPDLFKRFSQVAIPRYDPTIPYYLFYVNKPGETTWKFDEEMTELNKKFPAKEYRFDKITQLMVPRYKQNKIVEYQWDVMSGKLDLNYEGGNTVSVNIKNFEHLKNLAIDSKTGAMSLTTPGECKEMKAGSFTLGEYADVFNVSVEGASRNTIVNDFDIVCEGLKPVLSKQGEAVKAVATLADLMIVLQDEPQKQRNQKSGAVTMEVEASSDPLPQNSIYPSAPSNYLEFARNKATLSDDYVYLANPLDNFKYLIRNGRHHGEWIERTSQLPVIIIAFHLIGEWVDLPQTLINRLKTDKPIFGNYDDATPSVDEDDVIKLVEPDDSNVSVEWHRKKGDHPATTEFIIATFLNSKVLLDYTTVEISAIAKQEEQQQQPESNSFPSLPAQKKSVDVYFDASRLFHYSQHHSVDYVDSVLKRMKPEQVTNKLVAVKYHCGDYHYEKSFTY